MIYYFILQFSVVSGAVFMLPFKCLLVAVLAVLFKVYLTMSDILCIGEREVVYNVRHGIEVVF